MRDTDDVSATDNVFAIGLFNTFLFMLIYLLCFFFFFFQAEDGIRDTSVTGVQTCALPIYPLVHGFVARRDPSPRSARNNPGTNGSDRRRFSADALSSAPRCRTSKAPVPEIGRASCRERVEISGVDGSVKIKTKWSRERLSQ